MIQFGILGSLQLVLGGAETDLGGGRRRGLVARLLVDANRVVPLEQLIDELWPDDVNVTRRATATVRTYVSRLRKVLGHERILTRAPGHVLMVQPGELDAMRFESLVSRARDRALAPLDVVALLDDAERLWRGPALVEFADMAWARPVAERLTRRRIDATADRLDALVACGRPQEVASEAEALVEQFPLDERLWGLLLVGHYQSGRQADALRTYQRAHRVLQEELGLVPGPSLRALEQAVLRHDPALDPPPWRILRGAVSPHRRWSSCRSSARVRSLRAR